MQKYSRDIPTRTDLEILVNKHYSTYDIGKHLNKCQTSIRYWLKKYQLKTNKFHNDTNEHRQKTINVVMRNWNEMQIFYNNSFSWREVGKNFKISQPTINKAVKLGLLKSRTLSESLKLKYIRCPAKPATPETRRKISESRKKYLAANPNNPAWKKNNKKFSIPCEKVKEYLKELNISFTEEFQPLLHKRRFFSIDIAFPQMKIGIEINGNQHYDINGKLKPYYQTRHDLIESEGWKLYEIPYRKAFNKEFILELVLREGFPPPT